MNIENLLDNRIIPIEINIENIDVKGQYLNLAKPIFLRGQLNITKLLAEYPVNPMQDFKTSPLTAYSLKIGVDEAGRGPLLGSVNVAAAILPNIWSDLIENKPLQDTALSILTDSKQLSEKKRDILYPLVQHHAIGYLVADIPAAVIDQVNILQATMLGMRLCTEKLLIVIANYLQEISSNTLDKIQAELLFDGNRCPELDYSTLAKMGIEKAAIDCQAWVKGDARHTSIAAASILAKVSRDQTMYELDAKYPQYGIAKHKGYPTKVHMQVIDDYGVLPEHRRSFAPVRRALEAQ